MAIRPQAGSSGFHHRDRQLSTGDRDPILDLGGGLASCGGVLRALHVLDDSRLALRQHLWVVSDVVVANGPVDVRRPAPEQHSTHGRFGSVLREDGDEERGEEQHRAHDHRHVVVGQG